MTLALGLAATLLGADLTIAGFLGKSFTGLLFGQWNDATTPSTPPGVTGPVGKPQPGTADTGGVHANPLPPAGLQGPIG